jgi:hypothetical protein
MEEEMKVRTNNNGMKQLKKLGFKKVPGTEPGFHMYELNPATLRAHDQQPLTTKEYNRIKNAKKK